MLSAVLGRVRGIFSTVREVVGATTTRRSRRFLLLLPILLIFAIVIALITSSGALAPFVYPLF